MKLVVSAVAVAALAWVAAPWVSMARRGTIDRRTLEAMRQEIRVPAPRRAPDAAAGTGPRTTPAGASRRPIEPTSR